VRRRPDAIVLRVDPIACDGYGHCAEWAPELVSLDEWGYPVIAETRFPTRHSSLAHSARLAVSGCPRQALWLERVGE